MNIADNVHRWGVVQQTNQAAELFAFYEAMLYSLALEERGINPLKVVIMTRSSYLAKGLTEHIYRWEKNGWRDNKNRIIKNMAAFERIHENLDVLRKYSNFYVSIWLVDKKHNTVANSLAKGVLEGSMRRNDLMKQYASTQPLLPSRAAVLNAALAALPSVIFQTTTPSSLPFFDAQTVPLATSQAHPFNNASFLSQTVTHSQEDSLDFFGFASQSYTASHHATQEIDHPPVAPKKTTSDGIDAIIEQMVQPLDLTTPCFHFWFHKAPHSASALELSKRLKIKLASQKAARHQMIQVMYAVRRLVVTGEDREENFELLFGPHWREGRADLNINLLWLKARLEVLCCPKPKFMTHIIGERDDETAPRWTPRGPSPDEEKMIRALLSEDRPDATTA